VIIAGHGMKKILSCLVVACVVLGCGSINGVPGAKSFAVPDQYILKSAAHWKLIADDVANHIASTLRAKELLSGFAIRVVEPDEPTSFSKVFVPMLQAALLQHHIELSADPNYPTQLKFKVDEVVHSPSYRKGTLTALGAGLLVLRDAWYYESFHLTNAGGLLGAVVADRYVASAMPLPQIELVLSTSVEHEQRVISAKTDIYYLSSDDASAYRPVVVVPEPKPLPTGREFPVVNSGGVK
jgi:hypothetical protein